MEKKIKIKKRKKTQRKMVYGIPCWDCKHENKPSRLTCTKCQVDL